MRSTPSLPLLPGPLWPGMVAPICGLNYLYIYIYIIFILNCIISKQRKLSK